MVPPPNTRLTTEPRTARTTALSFLSGQVDALAGKAQMLATAPVSKLGAEVDENAAIKQVRSYMKRELN